MKNKIKNFISSILLNEDALPLFYRNENKKISDIKFNLYSFGNKNKNKIFYVIRRSPGAGLFSNVIYVLNHLSLIEKTNFIPIIDMENFTTIYNEKNKVEKTFNAWEYYFEKLNKYTLKEVYQSQNVILTNNNFSKFFNHNICTNHFRNISKKYLKIKKKFKTFSNIFYLNKLSKNTLAVHYRGTSYKSSANHPYPATNEQTIDYIEYLIKKYNYDKIFLCTEDLNFFEVMKKKFNKKLICLNSFRSTKDDAFKIYPRINHRYYLGEEILLEALIISKCKAFLHAITNVSMFIKHLDKYNEKKYFILNNGINTSNEFLAPYTWFFKKILPENLGGFKKKIF